MRDPEQFREGEDVVRQGQPGESFYVLARGQADVLVEDDIGERRVNVLHEGDYFGELSLLSAEPRTATVRTSAPTELYKLSQRDFLLLMERHEGVREAISSTVKQRRVNI